MDMVSEPIAIIGGTGDLGQSLAQHFTYHGIDTIIGSRKRDKARRVAEELRTSEPKGEIIGKINAKAAANADFIVLTIPFWAHDSILNGIKSELEHKHVLDTSVPMQEDAPDQYDEPEEGSAGFHVLERLPDSANLATGFHTVSAHSLGAPPSQPSSDVFYCGNQDTKTEVENLLEILDFDSHDAGSLERSGTLERLTPMLIHFNMEYDRTDLGLKLI
jgi:NADPH-dependent F420 reductase